MITKHWQKASDVQGQVVIKEWLSERKCSEVFTKIKL